MPSSATIGSMKRRSIWIISLVLVAVVGLVVLLFLGQTMDWVGYKDLDVRFTVSDAATGIPIPNASVHVAVGLGGVYKDRNPDDFVILTDQNGLAASMSKDRMCFGRKSVLEDTFGIDPPDWQFYVTAEGYANSKPRYAQEAEFRRQVIRGNQFAILPITIQLVKDASQLNR